jgi:hypothetical protein
VHAIRPAPAVVALPNQQSDAHKLRTQKYVIYHYVRIHLQAALAVAIDTLPVYEFDWKAHSVIGKEN